MKLDKNYMVFKDEYNKYKIGISHKNMEGKIEYANFPVRFRKDISLENKTIIKIKNYWLDFYNWEYQEKKGTTFYIFINDFEVVEQEEENPFKDFASTTDFDIGHQIEITESDLPF